MKIFKVPVQYSVYGTVDIEAESYNDLLEKLNNKNFISNMDLPDNPQYVEDSYEIDYEELRFEFEKNKKDGE